MLIDTHAHLTSETMTSDVAAVIERAKCAGITKIVNICTDSASLEKGLKLATAYPWIYNTAATTPHDVETEGESFFSLVVQATKEKKLVAIGETGLDYFYQHAPRTVQQKFLKRYFHLAQTTSLPVVIHCREAFDDLFELADENYKGGLAVLHCFTGTLVEARKVLERGWILSFSGIITFKKSEALREVVRFAPLDRLFIETDAPYLAPQSKRGQRNEPAFLVETARLIAELKGISLEQVAKATYDNAIKFFSLSKD